MTSRGPDATDRPWVLAERATLDVFRGELSSATARMIAARDAAGGVDLEELDGVRQAVHLHLAEAIAADPDVKFVHPATAPLADLRNGKMPEELHVLTFDESADFAGALRASLAGDAAPLAQALATSRPMWEADVGAVLAIVPRLHEHREQLVAALHHFHDDYAIRLDRMPFDMLGEASMSRDLARLAGDDAAADHWQQLITAQFPLLDDPDKVIALLLWQEY
jgi:hypothetical protein